MAILLEIIKTQYVPPHLTSPHKEFTRGEGDSGAVKKSFLYLFHYSPCIYQIFTHFASLRKYLCGERNILNGNI